MFWRNTSLIIILFLAGVLPGNAQHEHFSYIYIQGDKETPFYVKLDGQMMPRYGKNYCILSELDAGEKQIEILFQQNEYPAERYDISVPANGYRGFLLLKNNGEYELYDLDTGKYIKPLKK